MQRGTGAWQDARAVKGPELGPGWGPVTPGLQERSSLSRLWREKPDPWLRQSSPQDGASPETG